jgi:hypothetical protein
LAQQERAELAAVTEHLVAHHRSQMEYGQFLLLVVVPEVLVVMGAVGSQMAQTGWIVMELVGLVALHQVGAELVAAAVVGSLMDLQAALTQMERLQFPQLPLPILFLIWLLLVELVAAERVVVMAVDQAMKAVVAEILVQPMLIHHHLHSLVALEELSRAEMLPAVAEGAGEVLLVAEELEEMDQLAQEADQEQREALQLRLSTVRVVAEGAVLNSTVQRPVEQAGLE